MLPSGLEYTLGSCDAKGKKGMVLYKDAGGNSALFVAKRVLSNHNETLLSLFGRSITASCTELLFNFVSLCYDYEHNKDYASFKAVVLKLLAAKRPFDTTQNDLKHFPVDAWNRYNKDVMMYCFFKRCYDDKKQFKQCLHFAQRLFEVSPHWLSP